MNPEQLARIFDKYAQSNSTISRELAQMMSGDILAESTLRKGSCFTALLRLPEVATLHQAL